MLYIWLVFEDFRGCDSKMQKKKKILFRKTPMETQIKSEGITNIAMSCLRKEK